ncbi:hypothetical protein HaLaN_28457, partial [Haematococcus lacustris]
YDLHFDFRRLARLGPGERAARTWGPSLTRPQLLAEVVPPPAYATAKHFRDLHAKLAASADSAPAHQPAEAEGCQEPAAGGRAVEGAVGGLGGSGAARAGQADGVGGAEPSLSAAAPAVASPAKAAEAIKCMSP